MWYNYDIVIMLDERRGLSRSIEWLKTMMIMMHYERFLLNDDRMGFIVCDNSPLGNTPKKLLRFNNEAAPISTHTESTCRGDRFRASGRCYTESFNIIDWAF